MEDYKQMYEQLQTELIRKVRKMKGKRLGLYNIRDIITEIDATPETIGDNAGSLMLRYIERQIEWSQKTFGHSVRTEGICKHIESELAEIRAKPNDLMEWVDVIILAIDGAWRAGYDAEQILDAMDDKQDINFKREWKVGNDDEPVHHATPEVNEKLEKVDPECPYCERKTKIVLGAYWCESCNVRFPIQPSEDCRKCELYVKDSMKQGQPDALKELIRRMCFELAEAGIANFDAEFKAYEEAGK